MITKERLLAGLHEIIYVEEGVVTMSANFAKVLVAHTEIIEEKKKEEMTKLLSRLHSDSTRHKGIIDDLIRKVSSSSKNEY